MLQGLRRPAAQLAAACLVVGLAAAPTPARAASARTVASSAAAAAALVSSPRTVTRVDSSVQVTPDSLGRVTIPYCPASDPCAFAAAPANTVVTGRSPTGGGPPIPAKLVAYNRTTTGFTLRAFDTAGAVITTPIQVWYHAASALTANEEVRSVSVTTDVNGYATVGYAGSHGGQAATAVVASGVSPSGGTPDIVGSLIVPTRTATGFRVRAINPAGAVIANTSITLSYYAAWAARIDYSGTGWVAANATTTVSTDANGYATVSFGPPLPSAPTGIVASPVAPAGGVPILAANLIAHSPTTTGFRVRVISQSNSFVANQSVTLSYHAVAAVPDFTLSRPDTLHSNGADLGWSKYTGALSGQPFTKYEAHRSGTANFTPSASTLLMSTTDISTISYRDTTARPGGTFYYKVLANSTPSQEFQVTLPADGQATKLLQPDATAGKDTKLFYQYFASGNIQCGTYGTEEWLRVGSDDASTTMWRSLIGFDLKDIPTGSAITSATMSLWKIASNAAATVSAYPVTRDWVGGTYGCFNGATWYTAANGVNWTANGGDHDATAVASRAVPAGEAEGWHDLDIRSAAQSWVNGTKPNRHCCIERFRVILTGDPPERGLGCTFPGGPSSLRETRRGLSGA